MACTESEQISQEGNSPRQRILVAEDDAPMRQLLASTLRRDGFEVIEACNGFELLDLIGDLVQSPNGDCSVDLVITDINMPIISGLNVLTELRWAEWSLPVILITAFGDKETHEMARRMGAVALFDKPFQLNLIRSAAKQFARARPDPRGQ